SLAGLLDIDGARTLDLFAGTGAVGLEALSRGASWATFVDADRSAVAMIKANIATVGIDRAEVYRRQAASFLVNGAADDPFDLAFVDPPYRFGEQQLGVLLGTLATPQWLADDAVVVVERSARGPEPQWPDALEPLKQKRYGEGVLWYGRRR
ncbi:MAG TPA: RsmD family RNA methyltransferase, partial [Jatrophihabitantaceae bacterium]|nr:RsmD family RNA methyltransferase [Jatrophihabitantaceae bacterium]